MGSSSRSGGLPDRLLVAEDSFLEARWMCTLLERWGYEVVGPVGSVAEACGLVAQTRFSGAVLDINLGGETCLPVVEALEKAGVPYFFVTGYVNPEVLPERFARRYRLRKPFDEASLRAAVERELLGRPGTPPVR